MRFHKTETMIMSLLDYHPWSFISNRRVTWFNSFLTWHFLSNVSGVVSIRIWPLTLTLISEIEIDQLQTWYRKDKENTENVAMGLLYDVCCEIYYNTMNSSYMVMNRQSLSGNNLRFGAAGTDRKMCKANKNVLKMFHLTNWEASPKSMELHAYRIACFFFENESVINPQNWRRVSNKLKRIYPL